MRLLRDYPISVLAVIAALPLLCGGAAAQDDPAKEWAETSEPEKENPPAETGTADQGQSEPVVTEVPTEPEGCFPPCRKGYLCYQGECIQACNPPCADDEKCTADGECVPKVSASPVPATPPLEDPRYWQPQPGPALTPEPEQPYSPYSGKRILFSFAPVFMECATGNERGCKTSDGEFGIGGNLLLGYRLFDWITIEGGVTLTSLAVEAEQAQSDESETTSQGSSTEAPERKFGMLFSGRVGARFFPLARNYRFEPFVGIHMGYLGVFATFEQTTTSSTESSSTKVTQTTKTATHGFLIDYALGFDIRLHPRFFLGATVTVYEPFFVSSCAEASDDVSTTSASTTGAPDTVSNSSSDKVCDGYKGDHSNFFFGTGVQATILF